MQTLREQGLQRESHYLQFSPDKEWKFSTFKKVYSRVDRIGSAVLRKPDRQTDRDLKK